MGNPNPTDKDEPWQLTAKGAIIQAMVKNGYTEEQALAALDEYADQRVKEARIDELQKHGDQWRAWQVDTTNVKLEDVINWYDVRIAELLATLKESK